MTKLTGFQKRNYGKMLLTALFTVISLIYVFPVLMVVINSFKGNTFVKTETFALPTPETFVGWDNFITGMTLGGTFWSSVFYSLVITVTIASFLSWLTYSHATLYGLFQGQIRRYKSP